MNLFELKFLTDNITNFKIEAISWETALKYHHNNLICHFLSMHKTIFFSISNGGYLYSKYGHQNSSWKVTFSYK